MWKFSSFMQCVSRLRLEKAECWPTWLRKPSWQLVAWKISKKCCVSWKVTRKVKIIGAKSDDERLQTKSLVTLHQASVKSELKSLSWRHFSKVRHLKLGEKRLLEYFVTQDPRRAEVSRSRPKRRQFRGQISKCTRRAHSAESSAESENIDAKSNNKRFRTKTTSSLSIRRVLNLNSRIRRVVIFQKFDSRNWTSSLLINVFVMEDSKQVEVSRSRPKSK